MSCSGWDVSRPGNFAKRAMEPPDLAAAAVEVKVEELIVNHSCERCRQLRRGCEADGTDPSGPCIRCQRADLPCVRNAPQKRGPKGPWRHKDKAKEKGGRKKCAEGASLAEGEDNGSTGPGPEELSALTREGDLLASRSASPSQSTHSGSSPGSEGKSGVKRITTRSRVRVKKERIPTARDRAEPAASRPLFSSSGTPKSESGSLSEVSTTTREYSPRQGAVVERQLTAAGSAANQPDVFFPSAIAAGPGTAPVAALATQPFLRSLSASASSGAGLFFAPTPPLPLALFPAIPAGALEECADLYFALTEVAYPMLHRGRTLQMAGQTGSSTGGPNNQPGGLPSLFVSSVLLMMPSGIKAAGLPVPSHWQSWSYNRALVGRVASEVAALLDSRAPASVEAVAGVLNVHIWAILNGMGRLGRQLIKIARTLLERDGHMLPCGTWEDTAARDLGALLHVLAGELPPGIVRSALRDHWIEFFSRLRLVNLVLALDCLFEGWYPRGSGRSRRRNLLASSSFDLSMMARPGTPMPVTWNSSFDPNFDPRLAPSEPVMAEALAFLDMEPLDPRRPHLLLLLPQRFRSSRQLISWSYLALRGQVDSFLVACKHAGLATPAQLPRAGTPQCLDPFLPAPITALLRMRDKIDANISQIISSFPEEIQQGLRDGSADALYAVCFASSGSSLHAFNTVPFFPVLAFLRMELHTSLGVALGAAISGPDADETSPMGASNSSEGTPSVVPPPEVSVEALAGELASGGPLVSSFIVEAIAYTRILEQLAALNQTFLNHTTYLFAFKLCALHSSLLSRLRRSTDPAHLSVLPDVQANISACLALLARYSASSRAGASLYSLALKMLEGKLFEWDEAEAAVYADDAVSPEGEAPAEETTWLGRVVGAYAGGGGVAQPM